MQPIEQIQQPNSNHQRVRPRLRQDPRLQLIDDPIGKQRLCLVTANLKNDSVRKRTEEPGKHSRLTSPSVALHIDHLRLAHLGRGKPLTQDAQFALSTDETGRGTHAESTGISCIKEQPPWLRQAVPWQVLHGVRRALGGIPHRGDEDSRERTQGEVFLAIADHL